MNFPSYRDRYLPALTARQIAALPDKARAPVILTVGAIEQHGPHLPVAVDALMGQVWLTRALPLLPPGAACYVSPPITIGKSNEHTGFPGTLMITKETLRALLLAQAAQLASWGFKHLAIVNTHGGNIAVIVTTLREIRARYGLRADVLSMKIDYGISAQEAAFGIHAGEVETSWLLAAAPQLVDMTKAACEYPAALSDPGELRPTVAPVTVAWCTRDLSVSGIMGDAPAATAAKGERWLEQGARSLAAAIVALGRDAAAGA